MSTVTRALGTSLPLLLAACASFPSPVAADVAIAPHVNSLKVPTRMPPSTLVTPSGERRQLAGHPIGDGEDGLVRPVASPDGRFIARRYEHRIVLLPTDGGPARYLSAPQTGQHYFAGTLWWDASSEHIFTTGIDLQAENGFVTSGLVRCAIASRDCTVTDIGDRELVAPLPTGGAVWTLGSPWDEVDIKIPGDNWLHDTLGIWTTVSDRIVRSARRALRRPVDTRTVLSASDGKPIRRLWSARQTAARGVDFPAGAVSGSAGVLLARERVRFALRTKLRKSRPQVQLVERRNRHRLWLVDPSGARSRLVPRSADGDRWIGAEVDVADGWAGWVRSRNGTNLVATMSADGACLSQPGFRGG